jgi:hypothetical protein
MFFPLLDVDPGMHITARVSMAGIFISLSNASRIALIPVIGKAVVIVVIDTFVLNYS